MTAPRRPGPIPVALAAFFAALNVWSFSQADWNGVWGGWFGLFLVEELWAAWARTGGTLSERLWAWLGIRPRRPWRQARIGAAGLFLVEFALHVVSGGQSWWSGGWAIGLTAVPVALVVAFALAFERGEGGLAVKLKDKAVRWLALRWLRGKLKEDGSMLSKIRKALEGWKLVIAVLATFAVAVYDQQSNGHAGDMLGAILAVLGWQIAPDLALDLKHAVPAFLGIVGIAGRVWRAVKQARAGASPSELLSTEGYVKAVIADQGVTKTLASAGVPAVVKR